MEKKIIKIGEGIDGLFIKNDRFNSTLMSFHFFIPLDNETISKNALLPFLISSCTDKYKEYTDVNVRLLELYGANLSVAVRKNGDNLHICIGINVINNEFTFENEDILSKAAELLFEMIFCPSLCENSFCEKDVLREIRKTVDRIEGEINNKRSFARTRLVSEMFGDDPYGMFVYGKAEDVVKINGKELYDEWKRLLSSAYIKFHVVGKHFPSEVFNLLKARFAYLPRENITDTLRASILPERDNENVVVEHYDVSQGKLTIGFTSTQNGDYEKGLPHLIFSDIFGGGTYSKLFRNVREKESLCYYCSASVSFKKGYMLVDSGIDPENADQVVNSVMRELDNIKKGNIEDFEIESSKKAVCENLLACYDSASALDFWYSKVYSEGEMFSPLEIADKVKNISRKQIVEAANCYKLHTIYKLLPGGEAR